jgi:hypothetical protein
MIPTRTDSPAERAGYDLLAECAHGLFTVIDKFSTMAPEMLEREGATSRLADALIAGAESLIKVRHVADELARLAARHAVGRGHPPHIN